jgi:hypothetical protein
VTLYINFLNQVVSGELAIIGDACENHLTICTDHVGLAKFSTMADPRYRKILHAFKTLLEQLTEDRLSAANQSIQNIVYTCIS